MPPANQAPTTKGAADRATRNKAMEIFRALSRYARNSRLFSADHPSCQRFIETYQRGLRELCADRGFLYLELGPHSLLLDGDEVVPAGSPGAELIEGLFGEGARTITVEKGFTEAEAQRLAGLLTYDWSRRSAYEEDLITATWRAEFEHIQIEIVDRFALAEAGSAGAGSGDGERAPGQGAGGVGTGDSLQLRDLNTLLEELRSGVPPTEQLVRMRQEEAALFVKLREELNEEVPDDQVDDLLTTDASARNELARQVEAANHGRDVPIDDIGMLVAELARLEPDPQPLAELGQALVEQLLGLLIGGELPGAANLLRRCLLLLDEDLYPTLPGREALRASLVELFGDRHRLLVAGALTRAAEAPEARASLFTLLAVLTNAHLSSFCKLGALVEDTDLDQVIGDALLCAVEQDPAPLVALIESNPGADGIAPLCALSRTKSPMVISAAMPRLKENDARVREAALRALRGQQSPAIKQAALDALKDYDRRVRIEALRYLAIYRDPAHLSALEERLSSPSFAVADEAETRAWLLSFAMLGRGQAVSLLRKLALREQPLPGNHPSLDEQLIEALRRTDSEAGRKVITELARRRPELQALTQTPNRAG